MQRLAASRFPSLFGGIADVAKMFQLVRLQPITAGPLPHPPTRICFGEQRPPIHAHLSTVYLQAQSVMYPLRPERDGPPITWGQASNKIPSSSYPLTQNAAHEFGLVRAVQELGRWATRTKSHGSHSVSELGPANQRSASWRWWEARAWNRPSRTGPVNQRAAA